MRCPPVALPLGPEALRRWSPRSPPMFRKGARLDPLAPLTAGSRSLLMNGPVFRDCTGRCFTGPWSELATSTAQRIEALANTAASCPAALSKSNSKSPTRKQNGTKLRSRNGTLDHGFSCVQILCITCFSLVLTSLLGCILNKPWMSFAAISQLMGIEHRHRQSSRPATGRLEVSDLEDRQLLGCFWEDMETTSLWAVDVVSPPLGSGSC